MTSYVKKWSTEQNILTLIKIIRKTVRGKGRINGRKFYFMDDWKMIFYLSYRIKTFDHLHKIFNIKYARIRMSRKGFTNFYGFVLDLFLNKYYFNTTTYWLLTKISIFYKICTLKVLWRNFLFLLVLLHSYMSNNVM